MFKISCLYCKLLLSLYCEIKKKLIINHLNFTVMNTKVSQIKNSVENFVKHFDYFVSSYSTTGTKDAFYHEWLLTSQFNCFDLSDIKVIYDFATRNSLYMSVIRHGDDIAFSLSYIEYT